MLHKLVLQQSKYVRDKYTLILLPIPVVYIPCFDFRFNNNNNNNNNNNKTNLVDIEYILDILLMFFF